MKSNYACQGATNYSDGKHVSAMKQSSSQLKTTKKLQKSNYPDNLSLLDRCTKNNTKDQLQGKFVVHGNRVLHAADELTP